MSQALDNTYCRRKDVRTGKHISLKLNQLNIKWGKKKRTMSAIPLSSQANDISTGQKMGLEVQLLSGSPSHMSD